ncbi:hypothetical protein CCACVL1_02046 [Corchorus capsularis]|uniref:Uncharacterized protein n=1 Tax=Corchorus capsularis TaxID=210143 RepID=A0A1R3KDM4_COCAP|nr:hypothetical protein CCACVL1_02046 [Corchorus capsularis]
MNKEQPPSPSSPASIDNIAIYR